MKFTSEERTILLSILIAALVGIVIVAAAGYGKKSFTAEVKEQGTLININTADASEFEKLPGIGPSYAQRIVEFRKENGPFKTKQDLIRVRGIGKKRIEKIKSYISIK